MGLSRSDRRKCFGEPTNITTTTSTRCRSEEAGAAVIVEGGAEAFEAVTEEASEVDEAAAEEASSRSALQTRC